MLANHYQKLDPHYTLLPTFMFAIFRNKLKNKNNGSVHVLIFQILISLGADNALPSLNMAL